MLEVRLEKESLEAEVLQYKQELANFSSEKNDT